MLARVRPSARPTAATSSSNLSGSRMVVILRETVDLGRDKVCFLLPVLTIYRLYVICRLVSMDKTDNVK